MSVFSGVTPGLTAGLATLQQLQQDLKGPRSATSEEQIAHIKATLEAQRARLEQRRFKSPDLFKDSAATFSLRNRLQQALNRLDSGETRVRAVAELRTLIDQNRSEEALKVVIGCLADFSKSRSPKAREQEAGLIGFLAATYGRKLADSTLSPLHYFTRLMDLCLTLFKDMHRSVQEAAALSLCSLYIHSLPKEDSQLVLEVMYEPLYGILLSGVDVKAQQGAALALFKWIAAINEANQVDFMRELVPKVLALFVKLRPEYPDLVSAMGLMIESVGFRDFVPELPPFLSKLVQYLRSRSHGSFALKIESCKLLKLLGERLQKFMDILIGFSTQEVVEALGETKADKVPIVQACAREALEQWHLLARMQVRVEEEKMQVEAWAGEELIKHRTGLAELPRLVKERTTLELPVIPAKGDAFSDFKKAREAAKRKKESKVSREPVSYQWGSFKPKFLLKGTGHYTSIPLGAPDAPQPSSNTGNALQPYIPPQASQPSALNRDLLRAIIKTAPQKQPTTPRLAARVRESVDSTAQVLDESVQHLGKRIEQIEEKAASIKRNLAHLRPPQPDSTPEPKSSSREPVNSSHEELVVQAGPIKDGVTQTWLHALDQFTQGDLNAAFATLLDAGDDVYLMRLLHKSGVCLDQLSPEIVTALMRRLSLLLGSWIIPEATMDWCEEAVRIGLWSQLEGDTQAQVTEDVKGLTGAEGAGDQAQRLLSALEKS